MQGEKQNTENESPAPRSHLFLFTCFRPSPFPCLSIAPTSPASSASARPLPFIFRPPLTSGPFSLAFLPLALAPCSPLLSPSTHSRPSLLFRFSKHTFFIIKIKTNTKKYLTILPFHTIFIITFKNYD